MELSRLLFKTNVKEILCLLNQEGELYFSEISDRLFIQHGSLSRLLKLLYDAKLIDKRKDEEDERILPKMYYSITPLGVRILEVYEVLNSIENEMKRKNKRKNSKEPQPNNKNKNSNNNINITNSKNENVENNLTFQ
ncbi:MarR family winged helix-turn-helix transcriptional regulator [Methanococcus voltae]|uniref:Transcriptional regulator, MarR family n=1 Tax=Methanococcus voltae (strain ATCC BAA-1334 / A3) TaxID=456320 RepID=D7DSK3_METV3|nr:MarR family transcriptional regulator [Methanococcus voltae]MCS3901712.1 DNA-binding HxlR family transcriptional regulator [Methanococcus voltae]